MRSGLLLGLLAASLLLLGASALCVDDGKGGCVVYPEQEGMVRMTSLPMPMDGSTNPVDMSEKGPDGEPIYYTMDAPPSDREVAMPSMPKPACDKPCEEDQCALMRCKEFHQCVMDSCTCTATCMPIDSRQYKGAEGGEALPDVMPVPVMMEMAPEIYQSGVAMPTAAPTKAATGASKSAHYTMGPRGKPIFKVWTQCGGKSGACKEIGLGCKDAKYGYCEPNTKCTRQSEWYWQCMPKK